MEYMAFSKPIVQFEVTEGRFSAQEASLYANPNDPVDMADKIEEILSNPEEGKKMGEQGRKRVLNELSWKQSISPLISAYRKVLNK
jgi:glycosyltransferase involved in cell wall biosynthesis